MFSQARFKLTAWYLIIIMLISMSFSMVIYRGLISEMERFARVQRYRIERGFFIDDPPGIPGYSNIIPRMPNLDPSLVQESKRRIQGMLVVINGGIFILAGALGYGLAGKTLQPIKKMLDEQNRFISDSSHEFRTPLTSLKSAMEVSLRDKHMTLKDARILITDSISDINRLQMLSDQLLELAQFQKQNNHTIFEALSLSEVIHSAVKKINPMATEKQVLVETDLTDIDVRGNKFGLVELFVILLDNAVKYSRNNSTVSVRTEISDKTVRILVSDKGIGIDASDIERIFDRFYRADKARLKSDTGGYGLGLSIAKKIADMHRATITVTSIPDKGTTFAVSLPIK